MTKWHHTIDLVETWKNAQELGPQKVATALADALEKLNIDSNAGIQYEKSELVEELRGLATDDSVDFNDFDCILAEVYDWADQPYRNGKLCWIKTF